MTFARSTALAVVFLACGGSAFGQPADNARLDLAPDELPTNLVKILRTTNKAQTNRYVPKVYTFEHVNPYAVIRFVRRVMEIEEGAWFAFANPGEDGGRLLVSCPEYQIAGLDQLMATIDRAGLTSSSGSERAVLELRHRDAEDPGLFDVASAHGTPTVEVEPDTHLNALFLEDAPSGIAEVKRAVADLYDVPTPQLEAAVRVYEVDISDDGQLGLDYISWKNGPGRNLAAVGLFAQKEKVTTESPTGFLLYNSGKNPSALPGKEWESTGRNGAVFYELPSAYFDFLVAKGRARILSQSKLVALNRTTALLQIGDEIQFYKVNHGGDLRGGARLQPLDPFGDLEPFTDTSASGQVTDDFDVKLADHPDNRTVVPKTVSRALGAVTTGYTLEITPDIYATDSEVVVFASLVNHVGYSDDGTPVLASRTVDTVVNVPNDATKEVTLGGLVRQRRVDGANKVPWLGDVPVLGYLFGGESRLDHKTLVVTTLTTRVLHVEGNLGEAERGILDRAAGTQAVKTPDNAPGFLDD